MLNIFPLIRFYEISIFLQKLSGEKNKSGIKKSTFANIDFCAGLDYIEHLFCSISKL